MPMRINILSCIVINIAKMFPTVLLNLFIIVITFRYRSDNITTKTLLMNLVIVDLLIGCFTNLFTAVELMLIYLGKDSCYLTEISMPISFTFGAVSFITLAVLAVDSFFLFCFPFKHEKMQSKTVVAGMLVSIWVISLYPIVASAVYRDMEEIDKFIISTGTVIVLINTFCYVMIYRLIQRHRRQIRVNEVGRATTDRQRQKHNSIVMCVIMVLVSTIFCYFPIIVLSCLSVATNRANQRFIGYFTYWAWTFASLNSLLNPILKFYRLAAIRKAFKELWTRLTSQSRQIPTRRNINDTFPL